MAWHFVSRPELSHSTPGWHINPSKYQQFLDDLKNYVTCSLKAYQEIQGGSEVVLQLTYRNDNARNVVGQVDAENIPALSQAPPTRGAMIAPKSTRSLEHAKAQFTRKYPNAPSWLWCPLQTNTFMGVTPFFNVTFSRRGSSAEGEHLWPLVDLVNELHPTAKGKSPGELTTIAFD